MKERTRTYLALAAVALLMGLAGGQDAESRVGVSPHRALTKHHTIAVCSEPVNSEDGEDEGPSPSEEQEYAEECAQSVAEGYYPC